MKNIFSILAIAILAFTVSSCQKVRTPGDNGEINIVNETYTAEINNTASYTFHLPSSDFIISEDALNAEISLIKVEDNTYNYTPKAGYVGTETIRLTNQEIRGFCGTADINNNSGCGEPQQQRTSYNYEIQLTVKAASK